VELEITDFIDGIKVIVAPGTGSFDALRIRPEIFTCEFETRATEKKSRLNRYFLLMLKVLEW